MQAPDCSPGHGAEKDAGRWLTSDLMHMFDSAGLVAKPKSAQTQKTAGTRASALVAPSAVSKDGRDARDNQSLSEKDVLVDALAEFMRPASQSTLRSRQSVASGSHCSQAGGRQSKLSQKQLAALEQITEHMDAAAAAAVSADLGAHGSAKQQMPVPGIKVDGLGGGLSVTGSKGPGGQRPSAKAAMPRVKAIQPHVNITQAAMKRRGKKDDENGVEIRPMHPIMISRRFNQAKDDLSRTLKAPPASDPSSLRRFRNGNHAVPARELGVSAQAAP